MTPAHAAKKLVPVAREIVRVLRGRSEDQDAESAFRISAVTGNSRREGLVSAYLLESEQLSEKAMRAILSDPVSLHARARQYIRDRAAALVQTGPAEMATQTQVRADALLEQLNQLRPEKAETRDSGS